MNELGHFALTLAWGLALFGIISGVLAARKNSFAWFRTTTNVVLLTTLCSGIAIFSLGYGFATDDYTNQYVWQYSNQTMDGIYKVSAIWGGMDGSMLLWAFILSIASAMVAKNADYYPPRLIPWVLTIISSNSLFFLTIVLFLTNPFRYVQASFIPPDGNGLNPLLQNPYMAIHPPMLYLGFTTLSIPFAFCVGALLSGQLDNEWIRLTRRWTLAAWGFLTTGIVLGSHWAYLELGWGGFWAWDPVENASFLPWLTATAFLHSVMVQQRKNMLKIWNISLIALTYGLTVFGTFLTRSGVVQSVHAFASTDVGWVFLLYLGIILLGTIILIFYRKDLLKPERAIESLFSREAAFLANNLLFLSICFATLWGVLFPILSEAVTGTKQTVGIPYFNAVNVPLFLLLILLMGIGPLIAWRKASFKSLFRTFLTPFLISLVVACILVWGGVVEFYPILAYSLCFFVLLTILGEFHRGVSIQESTSSNPVVDISKRTSKLLSKHRARYGGYIIHFGVLIAVVAITASMAHKTEQEFSLAPGQSFKIGRFEVVLNEIDLLEEENYSGIVARLQLNRQVDGETIEVMTPEVRHYTKNRESTSEVALRMSLREDVYLVLAGLEDDNNRVALKIFINPLQVWLWIGTLIVLAGTIIVIGPRQIAKGRQVAAAQNGLTS